MPAAGNYTLGQERKRRESTDTESLAVSFLFLQLRLPMNVPIPMHFNGEVVVDGRSIQHKYL